MALCTQPRTLVSYGPEPRIVGCGKCNNCRVNRKRQWVGRLLLEAQTHPGVSFATLTYRTKFLPTVRAPDGEFLGNLCPEHLSGFIKRLRFHILDEFDLYARHFSVGEYGERYGRPHYHCLIFGPRREVADWAVRKAWCDPVTGEQLGRVQVDEFTEGRAAYIVSYGLKGWTRPTSSTEKLLRNRHPEFTRMSRRPGIGAPFIPQLARMMLTVEGRHHLGETGDVADCYRLAGKTWPLDDYMKRKLREHLEMPLTSTRWRAPADYSDENLVAAKVMEERRNRRRREPAGDL